MINTQIHGDSVMIDSNKRIAYVNGEKIKFKDKMKGTNLTTINGKIYVDGYELVNGKWERTIKSIFYKYFN